MKPQPVKESTDGRQHKGFGKVILFGEHVVVYGASAIVAGVSEYTDCHLSVQRGKPGLQVIDNRPAVPGYKEDKRSEQKAAHELVLKHLRIDLSKDGLLMKLGGPLVPSSGIGASASDVVAFSRALSDLYGLDLSEVQINESAFVGEGGYHGTPSGVDNTAATFGGLLEYRRTPKGPSFAPLTGATPLHLVVVGTGVTASTTKVLADVRALKERDPKWWSTQIVRPYEEVFKSAVNALQQGDLKTLGRAMDLNHALCQAMTVSSTELDTIVLASRKAGALGAKMSGTGRGGIAVALAASESEQNRIAEELKRTCKAAKYIWLYRVDPANSTPKSPKSKL